MIIIITIPDAIVGRTVTAICANHEYNPETDGTQGAFAKKQIVEFVKHEIRIYETAALERQRSSELTTEKAAKSQEIEGLAIS